MGKRYLRGYANGANPAARMAKFILSEYVESELTAIWDFIALDNIDAADRFLKSADQTFQDLAKMPGMGRPRNFPGTRLHNLRSFRVKDFESYLIFYAPILDGIEVFHVLHGARNIDGIMDEGTAGD
jgi:toxin ParE1/3/4